LAEWLTIKKVMKKIGYVLSGGGARGFAHPGVIKLLEELGIKPYAIAGTSAGALAGALYAAGKGPEEICTLMKNNSYFGWSSIAWAKEGIFSMDGLRKVLAEHIGENDFTALKTKLFVAATDLIKGESVIFSKGNLLDAVIASASVPVVFKPFKTGDKLLVDGGILNNFPVEPLVKISDVIIGSYVNKAEDGSGNNSVFKAVDILDRRFHLAIANSVYSKVNKCDVFIEAPLHNFDMYDVKQADKIFDIGYNTALQHKEKLIALTKNVELTDLEFNTPEAYQ
jgi:NTE family protein